MVQAEAAGEGDDISIASGLTDAVSVVEQDLSGFEQPSARKPIESSTATSAGPSSSHTASQAAKPAGSAKSQEDRQRDLLFGVKRAPPAASALGTNPSHRAQDSSQPPAPGLVTESSIAKVSRAALQE